MPDGTIAVFRVFRPAGIYQNAKQDNKYSNKEHIHEIL